MNRLWFAGIFLCLIAGLCTFEQKVVTKTFTNIDIILEELYAHPENQDYDLISEKCTEIENIWEKEETPLSAMLDHQIISDTEDSIYKLKPLADNESDEIYPAIEEAKDAIDRFYEHSKVKLGNVF